MLMNSCQDCEGENPEIRISNNGTLTTSVLINNTSGNTVNSINNVQSGTISAFKSCPTGGYTLIIKIGNSNHVYSLNMSKCYYYDIKIKADNTYEVSSINRELPRVKI